MELYHAIAGISYMGDPRMSFAENPNKVANIVSNQISNFRQLYAPLIETLPNLAIKIGGPGRLIPRDTILVQDMDPVRRGNMVRRLPKEFRKKLYFQYQRKFEIPRPEFLKMVGPTDEQEQVSGKKGGEFEQRLARDLTGLRKEVETVIKKTVKWPSTSQTFKGVLSSGVIKSWKYLSEKVKKWRTAKMGSPEKESKKSS